MGREEIKKLFDAHLTYCKSVKRCAVCGKGFEKIPWTKSAQNLAKLRVESQTPERRKEIARLAGIASGKARRKKAVK